MYHFYFCVTIVIRFYPRKFIECRKIIKYIIKYVVIFKITKL